MLALKDGVQRLPFVVFLAHLMDAKGNTTKWGHMNVSDELAIEGAVRAVRNAKRIAQDALAMYETAHYESACILGVIALENVGRGRRMHLYAKNPVNPTTRQPMFTKPMEASQFMAEVRQYHEQTIRSGIVTLQFRSAPGSDPLFKAIGDAPVGSAERQDAVTKFKKFVQKLFNKSSQEFHKARTFVQYLELNDQGTLWNDPQNVNQEDAYDLVLNVASNIGLFVSEIMGDALAIPIVEQLGIKEELEKPLSPPTVLQVH